MDDLSKLVSEIKSSTEALQKEKAKTDSLFDSIGSGAIATDEKGRIERINQVALKALGYSSDEVVGQWYPKIIEIEDEAGNKINAISYPITRALLEGQPVFQKTFYKKKDGTYLPVEVTVSPTMLNNKPVGAIEVFRDFTEELKIDKAKTEFVSLAAHQLNAPLTVIGGFSQSLIDGVDGPITEKQRESVTIIHETARRMIDLVKGFLNVSRIDLGIVAIDPKPNDIGKIAETTVGELQTKVGEKSLHLEKSYDPSLPTMNLDETIMGIIFQNLLTNAIKYTPPGGTVRFSIKRQEADALIEVADTGYGIPKEQQSKIFTKLFRAENVTTKEIEGTGLGLYLVKSIIDTVGGKIWFESEENKGTTFFVTLPLSGMKKIEGKKGLA